MLYKHPYDLVTNCLSESGLSKTPSPILNSYSKEKHKKNPHLVCLLLLATYFTSYTALNFEESQHFGKSLQLLKKVRTMDVFA